MSGTLAGSASIRAFPAVGILQNSTNQRHPPRRQGYAVPGFSLGQPQFAATQPWGKLEASRSYGRMPEDARVE
jgi:hypothetical protein